MAAEFKLDRRLDDLLIDPREELDMEIKNWIDLKNEDCRANLAQALLASEDRTGYLER